MEVAVVDTVDQHQVDKAIIKILLHFTSSTKQHKEFHDTDPPPSLLYCRTCSSFVTGWKKKPGPPSHRVPQDSNELCSNL